MMAIGHYETQGRQTARDASPRAAGLAAHLGRLSRRVTLLDGWRRLLVAALVGSLIGLAHAPFDFPFVLLIAFPTLVLLLDGTVPPQGFGLFRRLFAPFAVGWSFGFGMYTAGLDRKSVV